MVCYDSYATFIQSRWRGKIQRDIFKRLLHLIYVKNRYTVQLLENNKVCKDYNNPLYICDFCERDLEYCKFVSNRVIDFDVCVRCINHISLRSTLLINYITPDDTEYESMNMMPGYSDDSESDDSESDFFGIPDYVYTEPY